MKLEWRLKGSTRHLIRETLGEQKNTWQLIWVRSECKDVHNAFCHTQVERSGPETVGSGQFRRFHGSSIPVNGSGGRIYPIPPGADRNRVKPAAGYGHRILASNSWHFPAGSGRKRYVSCRFQPEIHGILLQESSTWVVIARTNKRIRLNLPETNWVQRQRNGSSLEWEMTGSHWVSY
jgi:hypothetical protein